MTAFLNSLRANLTLEHESAAPSLVSTPDSLRPTAMASSTGSLHPPSPLAQPPLNVEQPVDPLDNIPPLSTITATTTDDKVEALHLVADSVAQQRQIASKTLIFHPLTIAVWVGLLAIIGQWLYDGTNGSYGIIATTYAGVMMAGLLGVRWATGGYIDLAEEIGTWKWVDKDNDSGNEDMMLLTRFGNEAIGALVLRGVKSADTNSVASPRKKRQNGSVKGVIRGWTVKNRYRHKGVGLGLLEEAVKVCGENGWTGPVFAEDHANSGRVLPTMLNSGFDTRESKAREMLKQVIEDCGASPTTAGRAAKGKR